MLVKMGNGNTVPYYGLFPWFPSRWFHCSLLGSMVPLQMGSMVPVERGLRFSYQMVLSQGVYGSSRWVPWFPIRWFSPRGSMVLPDGFHGSLSDGPLPGGQWFSQKVPRSGRTFMRHAVDRALVSAPEGGEGLLGGPGGGGWLLVSAGRRRLDEAAVEGVLWVVVGYWGVGVGGGDKNNKQRGHKVSGGWVILCYKNNTLSHSHCSLSLTQTLTHTLTLLLLHLYTLYIYINICMYIKALCLAIDFRS